MTPIDRLLQLSPDHSHLLQQAGVTSVELLAQADENFLSKVLESIAARDGFYPPATTHVRTWIYRAQEALGMIEPEYGDDPYGVSEAISMDEVPEVLIEGKAVLPRGRQYVPDIVGAPAPMAREQRSPMVNRAPSLQPTASAMNGGGMAPQLPPILRSDERRLTPADRARLAMDPDSSGGYAPEPVEEEIYPAEAESEQNQRPPLEKRRFQSFDEYQDGGRGIVPLPRKESPMAPPVEDDRRKSDGSMSRLTKRGVVYPHPTSVVFGAFISLAWRVAVVVSVVGLPYFVLNRPPGTPPPLKEVLPWLGGLLLLGILQLMVLERVRCRICTCHLFYSRRCNKNSKAHKFPFIGHVAALCLHLFAFQWFRCMYCGTAIRLTGEKKASEE